MDKDLIKRNIEGQIATLDKSFYNYWGKIFDVRYISSDLDILNNLLESTNKSCKWYRIISFICTTTLFIIVLVCFLKIRDFNLTRAAMIIIISFLTITNYYRYNRTKINLEHKIHLLNLLKMLD